MGKYADLGQTIVRSESLKLIVEIDGLPHYQNPIVILKDKEKTKLYEEFGYKVVRIPYFIQLTNCSENIIIYKVLSITSVFFGLRCFRG